MDARDDVNDVDGMGDGDDIDDVDDQRGLEVESDDDSKADSAVAPVSVASSRTTYDPPPASESSWKIVNWARACCPSKRYTVQVPLRQSALKAHVDSLDAQIARVERARDSAIAEIERLEAERDESLHLIYASPDQQRNSSIVQTKIDPAIKLATLKATPRETANWTATLQAETRKLQKQVKQNEKKIRELQAQVESDSAAIEEHDHIELLPKKEQQATPVVRNIIREKAKAKAQLLQREAEAQAKQRDEFTALKIKSEIDKHKAAEAAKKAEIKAAADQALRDAGIDPNAPRGGVQAHSHSSAPVRRTVGDLVDAVINELEPSRRRDRQGYPISLDWATPQDSVACLGRALAKVCPNERERMAVVNGLKQGRDIDDELRGFAHQISFAPMFESMPQQQLPQQLPQLLPHAHNHAPMPSQQQQTQSQTNRADRADESDRKGAIEDESAITLADSPTPSDHETVTATAPHPNQTTTTTSSSSSSASLSRPTAFSSVAPTPAPTGTLALWNSGQPRQQSYQPSSTSYVAPYSNSGGYGAPSPYSSGPGYNGSSYGGGNQYGSGNASYYPSAPTGRGGYPPATSYGSGSYDSYRR